MAVRPVVPAVEQVEAAKTGVMVRAASVKRTGMVMANTFLMKPRIRAPDLSLLPSSIDTIIHLWITLRYSRVSRLGNWILRKSGKPVRESRETMTLVKMEKKQRVGVRCSLRVPRGVFQSPSPPRDSCLSRLGCCVYVPAFPGLVFCPAGIWAIFPIPGLKSAQNHFFLPLVL